MYAVEFGSVTKAGMTRNPRRRMEQLKRDAKYAQVKLGDLVLSPPHLNYVDNELNLHSLLRNRISGTELFDMDLSDVSKAMEKLGYYRPTENEISNLLQNKKESFDRIKHSAENFVTTATGRGPGDTDTIYVSVPMDILLSSYDSLTEISIELLELIDTVRVLPEPKREKFFYKLLALYKKVKNVMDKS